MTNLRPVKTYYVIGDSHTHHYANVRPDLVPLHILCTGGSARGLANSKSRSQYGRTLIGWSQSCGTELPIFFKFGQVDLEFVYNFHRIERGLRQFDRQDCAGFIAESVSEYFQFLDAISAHIDPDQFRICSVFPPCLSDAACHEGYINGHIAELESERAVAELSTAIRELEIPDLRERTQIHALWNERVKAACYARNWRYFDDFSRFVTESGTVPPEAINAEHHHFAPPRDIMQEMIVAAI